MNIIERAAKQISSKKVKSLVELAADRLAGAATETPRPIEPPLHEAKPPAAAPRTPTSRRETRRSVTIDFERLRALGFALPGDQTALAEQIRLIKRPLVNTALSTSISPIKNRNVMIVTSASPNEGKTFVAINLALSMASEHGMYVLLIDADVAKGSIPQALGFDAEVGLIDVVSNPTIDLADVMVRTNIENLTILPSGNPRPGSSELLASARMERFVDDLALRYPDRIIIFDSPPVLARSEPLVLAKHVGQVVFVVEAERTSRSAVDEAIRLIGAEQIRGIVLNKAPVISTEGRFGQYYRNS